MEGTRIRTHEILMIQTACIIDFFDRIVLGGETRLYANR